MSTRNPETEAKDVIRDYDALFAIRTGLTLLIPKHDVFNGGVETEVHFRISTDHPRDIVFTAQSRSIVIKDIRKEYLDAAIQRGTIMVYEMEDEEMVRCTPCVYRTT